MTLVQMYGWVTGCGHIFWKPKNKTSQPALRHTHNAQLINLSVHFFDHTRMFSPVH